MRGDSLTVSPAFRRYPDPGDTYIQQNRVRRVGARLIRLEQSLKRDPSKSGVARRRHETRDLRPVDPGTGGQYVLPTCDLIKKFHKRAETCSRVQSAIGDARTPAAGAPIGSRLWSRSDLGGTRRKGGVGMQRHRTRGRTHHSAFQTHDRTDEFEMVNPKRIP